MKLTRLLRENVEVEPLLVIQLSTNMNLTSRYSQGLIDRMLKLSNCKSCEVDKEKIMIEYHNLTRAQCTENALEHLFENSIDVVSNYIEDLPIGPMEIDYSTSHLLYDGGLPAFPVSYSNITINISPDMTLSGIDKVISNTEELMINYCEFLKPSPVLSLLRLKKVRWIHVECITRPNWVSILNKYIDNNRDILDCQEELIQAGLREYAKL